MNIGELTATLGVDDTSLRAASQTMYAFKTASTQAFNSATQSMHTFKEVSAQTSSAVSSETQKLIDRHKELEIQLNSLKTAQKGVTAPIDYVAYTMEIERVNYAMKQLHGKIVATQTPLKNQKGILEEIKENLVKLEAAKEKAFTLEEIEKYNKKIQETKMHLKEYENAGVISNKTVKQHIEQTASSVTQLQESFQQFHKIFNMILGGAGLATAFHILKKGFEEVGSVLESTRGTGHKFEQTMMAIKFQSDELKRSLATGSFTELALHLEQAATNGALLADQLEYVQLLSQRLKLVTSEINLEASKELLIARNQTKPLKEREDAARKYLDLMQQLAIAGKGVAEEEVEAAMKQSAVVRSGLSEERLKWYIQNAALIEENKTRIEDYLQVQKNVENTEKNTNAGWAANAELRRKNQEFINKNLREQKETLGMTDEIIKNIAADYAGWELIPPSEIEKLADAWAKVDQIQAAANMRSARMTMTLSQIMGKETKELEKRSESMRFSIALTPQYITGLMNAAEATRLHQSHLGKLNTSLYKTVSVNERLQEDLGQIAMKEATLGDLYDDTSERIKAYNEAISSAYALMLKDPTSANVQNVKNLIEAYKILTETKKESNETQKLGNMLAREFSSNLSDNISSLAEFGNALREAAISAISAWIAQIITKQIFNSVQSSKNPYVALATAAVMTAATKAFLNTAIPKFEHGGEGIVPSGYPNDSYPMLLSSGEHYKITPKENLNKASNGGEIKGEFELRVRGDELYAVLKKHMNKMKIT